MRVVNLRRAVVVIIAFVLLGVLAGCSGMEFAPKDPYMYWWYPKELPQADRAVEEARAAGKDKECPAEFKAAEDLKNKAYQVYAACRDQEAKELANSAASKAKALCPPKPMPAVKPQEAMPAVAKAAPAKAAPVISLSDINFDFDKATLTDTAKNILNKNIKTLKDNPSLKVRIEGHACAHGPEDYNQRLSERRANAVKEYFINEGGISADRLTTISYGKTRLLMPEIPTPRNKNSTEAKANRRVHFEVIQ